MAYFQLPLENGRVDEDGGVETECLHDEQGDKEESKVLLGQLVQILLANEDSQNDQEHWQDDHNDHVEAPNCYQVLPIEQPQEL